jgi:hypothetical protein
MKTKISKNIKDMDMLQKVYEFRSCPLELVNRCVNGEKYVSSNGDVLLWEEAKQDFSVVLESPLDLTLDNNTMENLTEVQLKLFWKLCK